MKFNVYVRIKMEFDEVPEDKYNEILNVISTIKGSKIRNCKTVKIRVHKK